MEFNGEIVLSVTSFSTDCDETKGFRHIKDLLTHFCKMWTIQLDFDEGVSHREDLDVQGLVVKTLKASLYCKVVRPVTYYNLCKMFDGFSGLYNHDGFECSFYLIRNDE